MTAGAAAAQGSAAALRVLHVAAEVFPLVKTGGLADVVAALPPAQAQEGADVRLLLPGLPAVLDGLQALQPVCEVGNCFGALRVRLLRGRMPDSGLPVYVVDAPYLYRRGGNPYLRADGSEWPDNLQRFALLGWAGAHLAAADADPQWSADVLHAHDWHAAMACAYQAERPAPPAGTVFTVHNLAYQGLFAMEDWQTLGLPARRMSSEGLEFHGQLSFMKAGLKYADLVTTVSPSYAAEIATPEFGCGLDGVIRARGAAVHGILNGIDTTIWDPAADAALPARYTASRLQGKKACRRALQAELGLEADERALLVTVVSRLTGQKGMDLLLAAMPALLAQGVQFAIQGTGDAALEAALRAAQQAYPGRVHAYVGYDEARAHRLIAGADAILVPSRFEPCGLTQMYGLRYGTLPIVRGVGGLRDTVFDLDEAMRPGDRDAGSGTGFVFHEATPQALAQAVQRAAALKGDAPRWRRAMQAAMARDHGWRAPAREYLQRYRALVEGAGAAQG